MNFKHKTIWRFIAGTLSYGLAYVTLFIFILAYLNGNSIMVHINTFGEAKVEFFILSFIVCPILMIGFYLHMKEFMKDENHKKA